jgi:hypothetical protein
MAAADLDDQLDALPTAAENATAVDSALSTAHGAGSWQTATSVTVSDKTGFKLASDGLAQVTAWTVNITGSLSGNVGGIAGTIQTLDGLAANLSSVHGSGSWEGGGAAPTVGQIADAVWDEATSGHVAAGTTGATLAAIKAKTDLLTAGATLTVVSPVSADGTSVDIVRGDSYLTADSNPLTMTITSDRLPSTLPLSTTVSLVLDRRSDPAATVSLTGTVTADGATKTVTFDAANTVTGALALGTDAYLGSVRFLLGGTAAKVVTAARLRVNVLDEARSSDA